MSRSMFLEDVAIALIIVCMLAIAWAMWKPVLLDQRNLATIQRLLNQHQDSINSLVQDITLLKKEKIDATD